jgi:hypothetical protein
LAELGSYILHSFYDETFLNFQGNNKIQFSYIVAHCYNLYSGLHLFLYCLGATVSVETEYSPVMSRQYLNVNFIPTAAFSKTTEGLCGFMDDDDTNDLTGPNGEKYNDTIQFAESCKYARFVVAVG